MPACTIRICCFASEGRGKYHENFLVKFETEFGKQRNLAFLFLNRKIRVYLFSESEIIRVDPDSFGVAFRLGLALPEGAGKIIPG